MSDDLIADLPLVATSFTGMTEHTDLVDIDRAVSGFVQSVVNSLVVTDDERTTNKEFARFAKRDKRRKTYLGRAENAQGFVKRLVSKFCSGPNAMERKDVLPAVLVSRDSGITFADGGEYTDITGVDRALTAEGVAYASLNKSFVILNYTALCVAWSEPTLDRLALGILLWLRHQKAGMKHTFKAKTMLAGVPIELNVSIRLRRDISVVGDPFDFENDRLLALPIPIEVEAEVYEAEQIVEKAVTVALAGGDQIE